MSDHMNTMRFYEVSILYDMIVKNDIQVWPSAKLTF